MNYILDFGDLGGSHSLVAYAERVTTPPALKAKLLQHQVAHADRIRSALEINGAALDASDTGTGKTHVACAILQQTDRFGIIICPNAIIHGWRKAIRHWQVRAYVLNYEQYVRGNTRYYTPPQKVEGQSYVPAKDYGTWDIPEHALLIWDEAHYIKSWKSQRTRMARAAINQKLPALYLSATICSKAEHVYALGISLKLWKSFYSFAIQKHYYQDRYYNWHAPNCRAQYYPYNCTCDEGASLVKDIARMLYHPEAGPPKASRMRRADIVGLPELRVHAHPLELNATELKRVKEVYAERDQEIESIAKRINEIEKELELAITNDIRRTELKKELAIIRGHKLAEYTHARRIAELHKTRTIIELAGVEAEAGSSIVVFVSFKETAIKIANSLGTGKNALPTGLITGQLNKDERAIIDPSILQNRNETIDRFGDDTLRVVVCTIAAGGVGIDLHDTIGKYPRVALISMDFDSTNLRQSIGRVSRAEAKTPAVCKILIVPETIEERICTLNIEKLRITDTLNNEAESQDASALIQLEKNINNTTGVINE